jgi:DNA-binding GntR family transcriptional regulator
VVPVTKWRDPRGPLQLASRPFEIMRESFVQQRRNDEQQTEKAPFLVVRRVRDAILDETFKPGDRLAEAELAEMFEVSRSPIREALFALESEGTVTMEPYRGAILKPLSAEEASDIAELRLALITLAAKPAHRHLSPADFDLLTGSLNRSLVATKARNTSNTTVSFGISYLRRRSGLFFGRCSEG